MSQLNIEEILSAVRNLDDRQKKAVADALNPEVKVYTREEAIAEINTLPQARFIDDFDMHHWLDKIQEYDPTRLSWHVRRLRGIGGSEIGSLWMAERGQYHPHQSCVDVVASKFLKSEPQAPEGNLQRGSMMEDPILRVKFREEMVTRYEKQGKTVIFRDDLFEQFMNYVDPDPQLSWLVGSPDDIMEVDGKLIIVDYKAPTSGTIAALNAYERDEAPIYYEAQLHHYSTIGEKLGMDISHTMLASLDYDKFTFDIREVPLRKDFQQELIDAGNNFWHNYVMQGVLPVMEDGKRYSKEVDMPDDIIKYSERYLTLSTIMNQAKAERDLVQTILAQTAMPISLDTEVVNAGLVNIEAQRVVNHEKLEHDLNESGIDTSEAHSKSELDPRLMEKFIKETLNISDSHDDAMDVFRRKDENNSIDVVDPQKVVNIARQNNINISEYIISETARFSISRTKANGAPLINQKLNEANKEIMNNAIETLSETYKLARTAFQTEHKEEKRPKPAI